MTPEPAHGMVTSAWDLRRPGSGSREVTDGGSRADVTGSQNKRIAEAPHMASSGERGEGEMHDENGEGGASHRPSVNDGPPQVDLDQLLDEVPELSRPSSAPPQMEELQVYAHV